jgi:hypothetical protein
MLATSFASFEETLSKLVTAFERDLSHGRGGRMSEADLRLQYLDPLFSSLGWDVGNRALAPFHDREVVVEPPHRMQGSNRRPDYLFRISGIDKFVCEAKRPKEDLSRHHFQVQNYIFNLKLWIGVLADFEHFQVFLVGSQPDKTRPFAPLEKWNIHYKNYLSCSKQIWDTFARENVAEGSIERLAQSVVKVYRRGKQGWLIKPERAKRIDAKFLEFLETQRGRLAVSLHKRNPKVDGAGLTEATQRIIDRLLFQRICEDRSIDVGRTLLTIVEQWESGRRSKGQLWPAIVANFQHMSRTFNGGLFGKPGQVPHFIEALEVEEAWLAGFLEELAGDDSRYLLAVIPVEILGSVYERFLSSIVTDDGKIELKPEVKKSKGVYYTPKFVVDEVIERTVGEAISGKSPKQLRSFRVLDPACGSGSFLLGAFDRLCREHLIWLLQHPSEQKKQLCYESQTGDLRLTTGYKRQILVRSIFGVDIDAQAVEVTQMSLYLKVLEDETTESLSADHRLFPTETYLPNLENNIKVGDSLIQLGSLLDLAEPETKEAEARAFDWIAEFPTVFKNGGGFDTVVGNPPYFSIEKTWGKKDFRLRYFKTYYSNVYQDRSDILFYFLARAAELSKGSSCFIVSRAFLEAHRAEKLRGWLAANAGPSLIIDFSARTVFEGVGITTAIVKMDKTISSSDIPVFRAKTRETDERPLATQLADQTTFERMTISRNKFGASPWLFGTTDDYSLITKIDSNKMLAEEVFVIGQGMQTGLNAAFGSLPVEIRKDWGLPSGASFIRARNSDIQSWKIRNSGKVLIYPNKFSRINEMPQQMQAHLQKFKKRLSDRAAYKRGDCAWWQYTWPLHAPLYHGPRIICPYLAGSNRFAIDEKNEFLGLTDTTVLFPKKTREDIRYFLGLLNSDVLTWRFRFIGKLKSSEIREYFHNSVAKIPFHRIDWQSAVETQLHDRIVKLVLRLETLVDRQDSASVRAAVQKAENDLEEAVCHLYGLTEADREQVRLDLEGTGEREVEIELLDD